MTGCHRGQKEGVLFWFIVFLCPLSPPIAKAVVKRIKCREIRIRHDDSKVQALLLQSNQDRTYSITCLKGLLFVFKKLKHLLNISLAKRLLIFQYSNPIPIKLHPSLLCSQNNVLIGWNSVWLSLNHFVSYSQSQDCVQTPEFFWNAHTERTGREQ